MKKLFILFTIVLLSSCRQEGRFHVTGHITEATDTMMYLEHITLGNGVVPIDSVKLTQNGNFDLSGKALGNPEFYRLRIGGQCINLAFDSTETVTVEASLPQMSFGYKVEGSGTCDTIRILSLKLAELERAIYAVADNRDYTVEERSQMIEDLITQYKTEVKMDIIQNRYEATSSYYACFQVLGSRLLFDPMTDKSDLTWLRAVANAWNELYPGCERTENLVNIVSQGKRNQAKPREIVIDLNDEKVSELGIIDMTFPDVKGRERTLSELRGQVVLLDFTVLAMPAAQERTMQLREIYNKYHNRGFEVYQVSLDPDYHYWATHCDQLPWISVFNQEGAQSDIVKLYQVPAVPYYFLIDRNCDLNARMENIPDLEKAIEALL